MNDFTQKWVDKCDLNEYVRLYHNSSLDTSFIEAAGNPNIVIIDSSHQYEQTLKELEVYYEKLKQGGFIFLHDSSEFAEQWDTTGQGGVRRAINEFKAQNVININEMTGLTQEEMTYRDGCGIAIIFKSGD